MEDEIKALIGAYYDPLQLIDQLDLDMDELVEALWPVIKNKIELFAEDIGDYYEQ